MIFRSEQRESREGGREGGEGEREGEILPLITSWVIAPAGRCQNLALSDVWKALRNRGWSSGVRKRGKMRTGRGMDTLKGKEFVRIDYNINENKSVGDMRRGGIVSD